jgi:molybdopterin/thiamine biosynthesis adenylyltransferase
VVRHSDYFQRQIALWGAQRQARLAEKKIAIIGCGGLGSSLGLALGGSGIGTIDLVDFDTVALHNIHRQIALELTDEGAPKAEVLARQIRARNPFVSVRSFVTTFETFAAKDRAYDLILDATDSLPVRRAIDAWAKQRETPWVYGSVEAFYAQVCLFDRADFGAFAAQEHTPAGVAAPMVMQAAALQANLALRYVAGLAVERDLLYYLSYDAQGRLRTQTFTMPTEKGE